MWVNALFIIIMGTLDKYMFNVFVFLKRVNGEPTNHSKAVCEPVDVMHCAKLMAA